MELDRILLCPNERNESRTDWTTFSKLSQEPFNKIIIHVNEVAKCYESAIQLLTIQNR